jgi:23S rRNA G2445 N2-methylase RlmL
MNYLITTLEGMESLLLKDIKNSKQVNKGIIKANLTKEQITKLKQNQGIIKIYKLIQEIEYSSLTNLIKQIKEINFSKIKEPFLVRCEKKRGHLDKSTNIEQKVGAHIFKTYNKAADVKTPKTKIVLIIKEKEAYVTEEITREKLSKREYRIHQNSLSTNPLVAYAAIKFSKIKKTDKLIDPFANTGEIAIEAAKNKKQIIAINSNEHLTRKAEFNAEVAEVNGITFKTKTLEWLETESNAKIITNLPRTNKRISIKELDKLLRDFYSYAKKITKDTITVITFKKEASLRHSAGFEIKKEYEIIVGELKYYIIVLKKTI